MEHPQDTSKGSALPWGRRYRRRPDGSVAVLDNIDHQMRMFDSAGDPRGSIDLDKAAGRRYNYLTGIALDGRGGLPGRRRR